MIEIKSNYLEKPEETGKEVKEQLLFGKEPSVEEKKEQKKKYQNNKLNE